MKPGKRMGVVVAIAVAILSAHRVAHQREQHKGQPATLAAPAAQPRSPAKPKTWKLGGVTLTACELTPPNSGLSTSAWCAMFPVRENRADPRSRTIRLKLAVLRSRAQVANKDMLVFIAGGPGQAATDSAASVAAVLQPLLAHRNVLLLDQRGTGGSNALSCKDAGHPLAGDDDSSFDAAQMRREAADCLKQLASHADPRYYTTTIAVQDLEEVRKALGSPSFDLVGVSYGTRAAQFARCSAEPACKRKFGDPGQTLYQLRDALRANPHEVSFRDPLTWQTVTRILNENALASVVRMFAYTPQTAALLPLSIDAAAHGDVGPLLGQAKILSGELSELAGSGMQYSVICSEDADLLGVRPQDADTILGTRMVDALKAVCSVWPKGTRPADFHAPLKTDKPLLLLAGQYDPVTPPRYAGEVAKGLPNARVLILKGQAHSVMAAGCTPRLVEHFVE